MDDSPFTRRNSVDETYNYDEQMINVSNAYLRLLHSISDNYNNNLQTYQQLMDRCLTMGFHTQMNVFRLAHLNQRMHNENIFSSNLNSNEPIQPHLSPFIIPTTPTRIPHRTTSTNRAPSTNRRATVLNNPPIIRRQNSLGRRRNTEDTPILPNPFYTHYLFPQEDVVVQPTTLEIENATTIIRYNDEDWDPEFNTCPISLENFEEHDEIRKINACGHFFKKIHIDRWFEQNVRCPVCRHDIRNLEPVLVSVPIPIPVPVTEQVESDSDSDSMPDLERIPIPEPVSLSMNQNYDNSNNLTLNTDSEPLTDIIHNEDTLDNFQFQFNVQNLPNPQDINLINILNNELESFNNFASVNNNNPLSYLMNIGRSRIDLSNNQLD